MLAPLLLGEILTRSRLAAAALGFLGVLLVAQPGVSPVGWGHAAGLASAVCFAMNTIFTKQIMRFDGVLCVLFWMTLLQGVASLVLALPGGIPWPSAAVLPWIVVVGLTGLSAHFSLTTALGHAPASIVAPMEFVRLPVITLIGLVLYGEPVGPLMVAGAVVILSGQRDQPARGTGSQPAPDDSPCCCTCAYARRPAKPTIAGDDHANRQDRPRR